MDVCRLYGEELQKSRSNTFEDYFNRSEVTYRDGGEERTLSVLYLRYFEAALFDLLPYEGARYLRLPGVTFICATSLPSSVYGKTRPIGSAAASIFMMRRNCAAISLLLTERCCNR